MCTLTREDCNGLMRNYGAHTRNIINCFLATSQSQGKHEVLQFTGGVLAEAIEVGR